MSTPKSSLQIIIFILVASTNLFSQKTQDLIKIESQLDSLNTIKNKIETLLNSINTKIDDLEKEKLKIQIDSDTTKGFSIMLVDNGFLKKDPSIVSDIYMKLPKGTEVLVVGYTKNYFKTKIGNKVGFVHEMFFPFNENLNRISNYKAKFHKASISNTTYSGSNNSSKTTNSTSKNRIIHTGPRGGRYYINSKGKKVYIKK